MLIDIPENVAVPADGVAVVVPTIAALSASAINEMVTASLDVERVLPALSCAVTVGANAPPTV